MAPVCRPMTDTRSGRFIDAVIEKNCAGIGAVRKELPPPGRIIESKKAEQRKRAKEKLRRELKKISTGL